MITIREIRPEEAPLLSALSDSVGWNNAPAECRLLTETPSMRAIFAVADGEIAGSAGMIAYEPARLVFINLVIVKPEFRHRGIATRMIEHIIDYYRGFRTFKLHATPEGGKVYEKLGFETRRTISFFTADRPDFGHAADPAIAVRPLRQEDMADCVARDRGCFGLERRALLEFNFRQHPELALAAAGSRGFILGRRWKKYRHLSCLEADSLPVAAALAARAAALDASQTLSIITYDHQSAFQRILRDAGFAKVRDMIDMELGEPDFPPPAEYFAIYGGDMG